MDRLFDKAIAAALGMIEFVSLSETLAVIIVIAVLRIIHIIAAGWIMKAYGLRTFKSLGMTLEAQPANEEKKVARVQKRTHKDEAA